MPLAMGEVASPSPPPQAASSAARARGRPFVDRLRSCLDFDICQIGMVLMVPPFVFSVLLKLVRRKKPTVHKMMILIIFASLIKAALKGRLNRAGVILHYIYC
jgi:hypothetical protein